MNLFYLLQAIPFIVFETTIMISLITLLITLFLFTTSVLAQGRPGVTCGQILFGCYTARPTGTSTQPAPTQAANSASFSDCLVRPPYIHLLKYSAADGLVKLWCTLSTYFIRLLASIDSSMLVWLFTAVSSISANFKRPLPNCSMDVWTSSNDFHNIRNFPL